MNCADFEVRLAEYLDGALDESERALMEAHATTCAGCRELMEDAAMGFKATRLVLVQELSPPPDLLTQIAFQAPVGRIRHPWERQGLWSRFVAPLMQPLLQPRLAMGMAMTILSFAMLERCTGVKVQHIQSADLNPVRIWGGLEDKGIRLKDRAVKYYENLRWVYEIESRLGALQRQAAENSERQGDADDKVGSSTGQETNSQQEQREEKK